MKKALLAILVLALGSLVVSAQSIVKESPLGAYGAMHWTLSNGINVYVKASKLQPGWITIAGTSPGGYSHNYTPAQASSLKQLNTVMAVSGAGGMTAVELGKMLRADSARMRTYVERDEEGFAGSCKRTGLETALKVLQLRHSTPKSTLLPSTSMWPSTRRPMPNTATQSLPLPIPSLPTSLATTPWALRKFPTMISTTSTSTSSCKCIKTDLPT